MKGKTNSIPLGKDLAAPRRPSRGRSPVENLFVGRHVRGPVQAVVIVRVRGDRIFIVRNVADVDPAVSVAVCLERFFVREPPPAC